MLELKRNDNVIRNRLVALLVACYFLFAYFALLSVKPVYASEELQHHYETSGVVEDLESFFYNEENKTTTFSTDVEYDMVKMLYFLEYGYGYNDLYSIYIYTYIPLNKYEINEILFNSYKNTLTFGFTDTSDDVLKVDYNKLRIETKTENKGENIKSWYQFNKNKTGAFVKWQVELGDCSFLLNDCKERYYCISGIELHEKGKSTATEFLIGNVFHCYKNEDNLDCVDRFDNLPSVDVNVYHTFYRTGISMQDQTLKSGWQNQISSCYFSLPKYVGSVDASSLSSIRAEFDYKYTTPILVVPDRTMYLAFDSFARFIDNCSVGNRLCFYSNYHSSSHSIGSTGDTFYNYTFDLTYNDSGICRILEKDKLNSDNSSGLRHWTTKIDYQTNTLGWLFKDENLSNYIIEDDKGNSKISEDYVFGGTSLLNYYDKYKNFEKYLFLLDNSALDYSLLLKSEDNLKKNDRNLYELTYGFNEVNNDITKITFAQLLQNKDDGSLNFWGLLGNAFKTWWESLFNKRAYELTEICPIEEVNYSDLNALTDKELSNKYFIDINEIDSFRKFCEENKIVNKNVWLFRYDCSDYYSNLAKCRFYSNSGDVHDCNAFVAQEAVYLDFDVLEFGFTQKDGNIFTISPTHSPENVFNDLTAQQDVDYSFLTIFLSYIMLLLLAVAIVVLVILFWPVISLVLNGAGLVLKCGLKIVLIPFKLIGKIFKSKNYDDDS